MHSASSSGESSPDGGGLTRRAFVASASAGVLTLAAGPAPAAGRTRSVDVDVVVVGANVAGIAAVRELAAAGLTVALIEQGGHVGGMTSGGLSATDVGVASTIGGFSKQLYADIGALLGVDHEYYFSPATAQQVLDRYLREAHVVPRTLRPITSLVRHGGRWHVRAAGGRPYAARYVIDATYEGDLLPLAGIPFRLGRESSRAFGETLAGIRPPQTSRVDPWTVPGQPGTGPLPGVHAATVALGARHTTVQSPSYRLVLTARADRKPWVRPASYDPREYVLLARWLATGGDPLASMVPVAQTDRRLVAVNNSGLFSTDLVRFGGRAWIQQRATSRAGLARIYRDYTLGMFWYLANEPSVPPAVRAKAQAHGLDPELWQATGGFSPTLYVREGRRMVGRATLTQGRVERGAAVREPVAIGSYRLDAHDARWVVDERGRVAGEGGMYERAQPYQIPLGALLPRAKVPGFVAAVPVSASHVGWASLRMEPVFGMLGQAAGQLVALAARRRTTPAAVPYGALRRRLDERGARIEGQ